MTAMCFIFVRSSGSRPLFFSSTMDSRAIRNASAPCAGVSFSRHRDLGYGTISGRIEHSEAKPRLHTRATATSISASVTNPCRTAAHQAGRIPPRSQVAAGPERQRPRRLPPGPSQLVVLL